MRCDITLTISHIPVILSRNPTRVHTTTMTHEIEANTSLGFVYRNSDLSVKFSAPIKTSCSGNFCVRQRVTDWLGVKGCMCYEMSLNSSILVI